ncbi:MAG: bifunctional 2',3'-cyclic-nucleotide 2'-phosphodiesterase/3'-nucleotidase [Paracoccaceae bacterium]
MTDATGSDTPQRPADLHLRILATSDLHAHLCPWDYFTDQPKPTKGLARTAGLIAAARAEVANTLLLDNGDFLQGSPLGDFFALEHRPRPGEVHPVIAAMNLLGYDAATLGNHEFSHGLDFLLQALEGAEFPVVSANAVRRMGATPLADAPLVARYVLLDRIFTDGAGRRVPLKIGVFGVCPPQVMQWEAERLSGHLVLRNMVEAGRAAAAELRAAGADVVLALSHSGIAAEGAADEAENASLALAGAADVDALIAGHTHQIFPRPGKAAPPGANAEAGTLAGKPAVMPGFFGSHLGVIDLRLRRGREGGWQVAAHRADLRAIATRDAAGVPVALTDSDPRLAAQATPPHRSTRAWAQRPVGETPIRLCTHFALATELPALRLVAEAQAAHVARALRGTAAGDLPLLSAVAPFKAGGRAGPENYTDIPPGPLAMRHAAELYLHPNTLVALRVTGAELTDWLERGAGIFRQIAPGSREAHLLDPDFPSFNFDTIHGLTWITDLSQPARFDARGQRLGNGRRITGLCHAGRFVADADEFILATNSYRAGGGGGFPATGPAARIVLADHVPSRAILIAHIAAGGHVGTDFAAGWRLAPMPGTSVVLDTAPKATGDEIPHLSPEDLGIRPETGFRRFRLWL